MDFYYTSDSPPMRNDTLDISKAEFEPTIVIDYLHRYKGYVDGLDSWGTCEKREKYLITENLLCLPIINSYLDYLSDYKSGLELFMTHELTVDEYEKDEYKLQLKNKASSQADARYGHALLYVDVQEDPPLYDDPIDAYDEVGHVCFEGLVEEHEYIRTYFDEQNAVDSYREETDKYDPNSKYLYDSTTRQFVGKAFRAASKADLENLYNMLLDRFGVEVIVNFMFELLNIYRVLPKLNVGNLSKEVQKKSGKFEKEERRKRKADTKWNEGAIKNKKQRSK
eukprot:497305_1